MTTNNPNTIAKADVKALSPQPYFDSPFVLEFFPENAIDPGGGILVVYPPQTPEGSTGQFTATVLIDGIAVD